VSKNYRKPLSTLLGELPIIRTAGIGDPLITSVAYDSRQVIPGSLFIALRGLKADGSQFIREAIAKGAAAIISESEISTGKDVPIVLVENARKALAELSWSFFNHPERALTLVGVTGTNGKTTVASILRGVLEYSGIRAGLAGTLGIYYGDTQIETPRTTPESTDLAAHFAAMRDQGFTHVVMEVTSIGIDLERIWKLPFRVAAFTNLTRDHLDYHGTEDAYREAKLRLFREQDRDATAVINVDDPHADHFKGAAHGAVRTYGIESEADFHTRDLKLSRRGISFTLHAGNRTIPVTTPLIGSFNASNVLAVIGIADALNIPLTTAAQALREAVPARGRAEIVLTSAPFTIVVDYAHTPDALEKILTTLRELNPRRILTVVGAGGDRDRGKRPLMAEVSYRLSDLLFLTSDNPRSEDPESILDDMAAGLPPKSTFIRNASRRTAIEMALNEAGDDDIVLIAGKGHETYQEIQGVQHPFDDRQIVLEWSKRAGYNA